MTRRLAALVGALALVATSVLATAPGASAKALGMGQCTTRDNAVIAVNFAHWGGPIVRACGSTPTTGFTLLNQGGFRTEGTKHDGPAFICRIASSRFGSADGYPTKKQESCVLTPPAKAYWSYWHADRGQNSWTYSQLGAMSYKSTPGSVEYWQFGGTNIEGTKGRPTVTPDQLRAHNSAKSGSNNEGSDPGGGPGGGRDSRTHDDSTPGAGQAPPGAGRGEPSGRRGASRPEGTSRSAATTAARPSGTAAGAPASSPGTRPSAKTPTDVVTEYSGTYVELTAPPIVNADPASAAPKPKASGSAWPVILAIGLAVVLGAGGGIAVLRRRRAENEV